MKIFISVLLLIPFFAICQIETPAPGLYGDASFIRKDKSGTYFKVDRDTNLIVFIAEDWHEYRLTDKNNVLILSGDLGGRIHWDYFLKNGAWKEYYSNGKIKFEGYYDQGNPIGNWKVYYPSGQLKSTYNISKLISDSALSYCKAGSFEEYYENGQLKLSGFYRATLDTIVEIGQIPRGNKGKMKSIFARGHRSKPDLTWTYYKENGELDRREEYYGLEQWLQL